MFRTFPWGRPVAHFLGERGIPVGRFAEETGLHRKTVGAVLHGRARVTAETAVRFARALDTTPEFRLTLRNAVDICEARSRLAAFA
jgi:addiction module HigA family antidote